MIGVRVLLHSYALRDYPRGHVFRVAGAGRWPGVELAACHLEDLDVAGAVAQARAAGTTVHCAGYWGEFAHPDPARRQASLAHAVALVRACGAHGVPMVNGSGGWLVHDPVRWGEDWRKNGSAIASPADVELVADAYRVLAECGADEGVRVAVEVHPNTVHDTVAATARLLAAVAHQNLTVTLDPANAAPLSAADREPAVLAALPAGPLYFHLKNGFVTDGVADFTVGAADGVIDNFRWLAALAGTGRLDAVAVEYCGEGDPHPRLAAGRAYLADTMDLIAA